VVYKCRKPYLFIAITWRTLEKRHSWLLILWFVLFFKLGLEMAVFGKGLWEFIRILLFLSINA